jgi:hypothetical protein
VRRAPLLLAIGVLLFVPGSAAAGLLEPADQAELAQTLAEAEDEQGVCYGWNISNNFDGIPDQGSSNLGPGKIPISVGCDRSVVLTGSITYACESCEGSDSASIAIESNLPNPPTTDDLKRLGWGAGDLVGGNDDVALFNMINALPLIAAERGNVAFIPAATPDPAQVTASDTPTNHPGSDFFRNAWGGLIFFGFLLLAAPVYWLYKRRQTAAAAHPTETV